MPLPAYRSPEWHTVGTALTVDCADIAAICRLFLPPQIPCNASDSHVSILQAVQSVVSFSGGANPLNRDGYSLAVAGTDVLGSIERPLSYCEHCMVSCCNTLAHILCFWLSWHFQDANTASRLLPSGLQDSLCATAASVRQGSYNTYYIKATEYDPCVAGSTSAVAVWAKATAGHDASVSLHPHARIACVCRHAERQERRRNATHSVRVNLNRLVGCLELLTVHMVPTILQPQPTSALHCEAPVRAQTHQQACKTISTPADRRKAADSAVQRWCRVPLQVQNGEARMLSLQRN